jgi:hypothetical protein
MGCLRNSLGDHHAPITNLLFTSIVRHHHHQSSSSQPHQSHPRHGSSPTPPGHRPSHALHTTHRPSHIEISDQPIHPLPKHHPSFIQQQQQHHHHHIGSASHHHEQISHGVVRLVSTSADGVVHLWATMPHRVSPHVDRLKPGTSSRQSNRTQRIVSTRSEVHGLHADPSPVLHYDQDDGSGVLEPILLKVFFLMFYSFVIFLHLILSHSFFFHMGMLHNFLFLLSIQYKRPPNSIATLFGWVAQTKLHFWWLKRQVI